MSAGEILRTLIVLACMFSIGGWGLSAHLNWPAWDGNPRAKLVTLSIFPLLLTNGYGVAKAATEGYPITEVTGALAVCFVLLNVALWIPLPRDPDIPQRRATDR